MEKLRVNDKFKVSEIFYTIQGEGPNTGSPAVFVRLATCNLQCSWCDTPYTWDWKNYDPEKEIKIYDSTELLKEILKFRVEYNNPDLDRVVFTGGEPLLQQKILANLCERLIEQGFFEIEIETNGTIAPTLEMNMQVEWYNVSPKLENSGNPLKVRHREKALEAFAENHNAIFKFVVCNEKDFEEIQGIVDKYSIEPDRVYLMPEGKTHEELMKKADWLAEECKKHNYILCNRLQVTIWGDKRGT